MNKGELVSAIATKSKSTKKESELFLNSFIEVIEETLAKKEKITLVGFGSFEAKDRKARKGMNPQTKEEINIPAKTVPVFRPGKGLKDIIDPPKKTKDKKAKKKK